MPGAEGLTGLNYFVQRTRPDGLTITMGLPSLRTLMFGSSIAVLSVGMMNVGELQLAKVSLHAGNLGFSALVAISGIGIVAG